jgi:N-ethylmaleimide reductase
VSAWPSSLRSVTAPAQCGAEEPLVPRYGGAVENQALLLLEVVGAVSDVWGLDRVGVRLSPLGTFNDISDDDPETTFGHIAAELSAFHLAYLHILNPAMATLEKGIEPDRRSLAMVNRTRENPHRRRRVRP